MGNEKCPLERDLNKSQKINRISTSLKKSFIYLAIKYSFDFFKTFFQKESFENFDFEELASEYLKVVDNAYTFNLFTAGGILEKDFLLLWCLHKCFRTEGYIESGVFIGSSLYAAISALKDASIIGIDPNLKNLKLPNHLVSKCKLIDDKDFSEINFENISKNKSIVFFDDHINAAERIIESHYKGLKYLIFDDAGGLDDISKKLYPSFPTIPIIMNADFLSPGEEFSWIYKRGLIKDEIFMTWKKKFKKIYQIIKGSKSIKVTAKFDEALVNKCLFAKSLIKKSVVLPDLGSYILPRKPMETTTNGSKYIVQLI